MATFESLGYTQFYGLTPSIDFFKDSHIDPTKDEGPLNVLLADCADLRHLMKSLADLLLKLKEKREHPINIYIQERHLENLCRAMLFLTITCETAIAQRERMEIFLDIYANTLLRERTNVYLHSVLNELIQLVTEDNKYTGVLRDLIAFDELKFKERDEMEEIISSYHDSHKFDIEKYRDDRIRHHMGVRYDSRANLVDWDYQFGGLKDKVSWSKLTLFLDSIFEQERLQRLESNWTSL
jgi:dynein assembly factor 3, axonemal